MFTDAIKVDGGKLLVVGRITNADDTDMLVVRLNADGSLDTTFNGDGYSNVGFDDTVTSDDLGFGIVVTSTGNIVIAGYTDTGTDIDIAAAVLDASGSVVERFVDDHNDRTDKAWDIAIRSDTAYIAASSCDEDGICGGVAYALDVNISGFSLPPHDYFAPPAFPTADIQTWYNVVEVREDTGKVLLGGATSMYTADDSVRPLVTQLVAPDMTDDTNLEMTADTNFGNNDPSNGDATYESADLVSGQVLALEIDDDGRVVVGGRFTDVAGDVRIGFLRVTSNGLNLDTSFGGTSGDALGTTILNPGDFDAVYDLEFDSQWRIVFVGTTDDDPNAGSAEYDPLIGRLTVGGAPDTDFASGGVKTIDPDESASDLFHGLVLVDDQHFVAVGGLDTGETNIYSFSDVAIAYGATIPGDDGSGGDGSGGDGSGGDGSGGDGSGGDGSGGDGSGGDGSGGDGSGGDGSGGDGSGDDGSGDDGSGDDGSGDDGSTGGGSSGGGGGGGALSLLALLALTGFAFGRRRRPVDLA